MLLLKGILTKRFDSKKIGDTTTDREYAVRQRMKQYLYMEVPMEYIKEQSKKLPRIQQQATVIGKSSRKKTLRDKLLSLGYPQFIYEQKNLKPSLENDRYIDAVNTFTGDSRTIFNGRTIQTRDSPREIPVLMHDIIKMNNTYWWDFVYHLLSTTIINSEKIRSDDDSTSDESIPDDLLPVLRSLEVPKIPNDLKTFIRELKVHTDIEIYDYYKSSLDERIRIPVDGSFYAVKEAFEPENASPVFIDFENKTFETPFKRQYKIVQEYIDERKIRRLDFESDDDFKFCPAHVLHYGELVHLDHPSLRCTCERSYPV